MRIGLFVGMSQNKPLHPFAFLTASVGGVDQTAKGILVRAGVAGVELRVAGTDDDQR